MRVDGYDEESEGEKNRGGGGDVQEEQQLSEDEYGYQYPSGRTGDRGESSTVVKHSKRILRYNEDKMKIILGPLSGVLKMTKSFFTSLKVRLGCKKRKRGEQLLDTYEMKS